MLKCGSRGRKKLRSKGREMIHSGQYLGLMHVFNAMKSNSTSEIHGVTALLFSQNRE